MRIPLDIRTVGELASRVEHELSKTDAVARQGYVGKSKLANPDSSYLYMDGTALKFYNAQTGLTTTIA